MKALRRFVSLTTFLTALLALSIGGLIVLADFATWTQHTDAGQRSWVSIASSADGTKLAAAANGDSSGNCTNYIYLSTDSGATWNPATSAGPKCWGGIAMSADGKYLVAGGNQDSDGASPDYLHISTDGGMTWATSTSAGARNWWKAITVSNDGSKIVAAPYVDASGNLDYIYTSVDSGTTWATSTTMTPGTWYGMTASSDFSKVVAAEIRIDNSWAHGGYLYTSTDGGMTWATSTTAGQKFWTDVRSSADGKKLIAVAYSPEAQFGNFGDYIYTSADGGDNWTPHTDAGQQFWERAAISSDGTKMVAASACDSVCAVSNGTIWTSSDSGATWQEHTAAGEREWYALAASADGSKIAAAPDFNNTDVDSSTGQNIYTTTLDFSPPPAASSLVRGSPLVFVIEENESLSDTGLPGNSKMPYLSGLISSHGAFFANYYANTHPTLPNDHWILGGGENGGEDNDFTQTITDDNILRHLLAQGISFRFYVDGLAPLSGTDFVSGGAAVQANDSGNVYTYMGLQYSDIRNESASLQNSQFVDISQLAADITNHTLPQVIFILPDLVNDSHNTGDNTLADTWLQNNISSLLATSDFQTGGNGLLMVTYDEGKDNACSSIIDSGCGGHVSTVFYGPNITPGYTSNVYYQHQNLTRTIMEALGFTSGFPQQSAFASSMSDVFTALPAPTPPPAPAVVSSGGGWSGGCSTYPQGEVPSWGVVPCTPTSASQGPAVLPGTLPTPTSTSSPPLSSNTNQLTETQIQSVLSLLASFGADQATINNINAVLHGQAVSPAPSSASSVFTRDLELGDTGEDVRALQEFLNTHGYQLANYGPGSPNNETIKFGYATQYQLAQFQKAQSITPASGYLGPKTRAILAPMSPTSTTQ